MSVAELKRKINQVTGMSTASQRLFAKNCELENNQMLEFYNVFKKGKNKVRLIQKRTLEGSNAFIEPYGDVPHNELPRKI